MWFADVRVTTKHGYGSASVAVRAEKRATKSDKLIVLFSETETAKQNQKFPFHFFFRFAVEGWGGEAREKCKEIFWFLHTRVRERVRGALVSITTQSWRTERFRATTRSARAISRQNPADFARNTFELRPIHTAVNEMNEEEEKANCFAFGLWTVIRRSLNGKYRNKRFLCECSCGKEKIVSAANLKSGKSRSCGGCPMIIHGKSRTKVYRAWQDMIQRCHNGNNPSYPDYGGRGIRVCVEWRKSFTSFYEYVGDPPDEEEKWSIDRKNFNGDYEPGNTRWATAKEQAMNRRPRKKQSARRRNEHVPSESEHDSAIKTYENL